MVPDYLLSHNKRYLQGSTQVVPPTNFVAIFVIIFDIGTSLVPQTVLSESFLLDPVLSFSSATWYVYCERPPVCPRSPSQFPSACSLNSTLSSVSVSSFIFYSSFCAALNSLFPTMIPSVSWSICRRHQWVFKPDQIAHSDYPYSNTVWCQNVYLKNVIWLMPSKAALGQMQFISSHPKNPPALQPFCHPLSTIMCFRFSLSFGTTKGTTTSSVTGCQSQGLGTTAQRSEVLSPPVIHKVRLYNFSFLWWNRTKVFLISLLSPADIIMSGTAFSSWFKNDFSPHITINQKSITFDCVTN